MWACCAKVDMGDWGGMADKEGMAELMEMARMGVGG